MDKRKELKNQYKNRIMTGGIYCITCQGNGRTWMKSTRDLEAHLSRFHFSVSNNSCPEPGMREAWMKFGGESFSFTILEKMEKKEAQTDLEFSKDLDALLALWCEKQEGNSVGG